MWGLCSLMMLLTSKILCLTDLILRCKFRILLSLFPFLYLARKFFFCQTLGLVLRLRVDFVLPLSQQEQEEEQEQEQPLTKIYQKGVY